MSHRFHVLVFLGALVATGCSGATPPTSGVRASPVLSVWDTRKAAATTFDAMAQAAGAADFVFFGEQHDDPVTHAAELALLAAVGERRARVVLSLEMFERDVQSALDAYLAGRSTEAEFLAASRPWDRYTTDYRGMVELARVRGWPVIASNIPRRLASAVSRGGLAVLDTIPQADKRWIAQSHSCPLDDDYFRRFAATMAGHGNGGPSGPVMDDVGRRMVERFYEAQCTKDEAMGEAVVNAWLRSPGTVVVHYDGAFHSDFSLGTVARATRRAPNARTIVISAIPVASLDSLPIEANRERGDFLIFARRLPAPAK